MKKIFLAAVMLLSFSSQVHALACSGTVNAIYKWDTFTTLSIQLKLSDGNLSEWVSLPSKSDEALALMAMATGKTAFVVWGDSQLTNCVRGASGSWTANRKLDSGYFQVVN